MSGLEDVMVLKFYLRREGNSRAVSADEEKRTGASENAYLTALIVSNYMKRTHSKENERNTRRFQK